MTHYRYVAVGLIFVGQLILWAECIAPQDFDPVCRTDYRYRLFHDWIPYANDTSSGTWKVLIDQYDYQHLVQPGSTPRSVWSVKDFDGNGRTWGTGSGGTCSRQVLVRTYENPNANNWIFTQAIDYLDAVELIVNATVRFASCTQRPDCTNDYTILHRYDTSTLVSASEGNNTANYRPYLGTAENSRLQQDRTNVMGDTVVIERFRRPPNAEYTYLGIQDIGSFGSLTRIFMYYEVCPGRVEGLVTYPEVPYPGELPGALPRTTRLAACAEHAHNTTSLETYAYQDGRIQPCEQTVSCECDAGYEEHQNGLQCVACTTGRYRSAQNSSCVDCPANSMSTMPASQNCSCSPGYYRKTGSEGFGVRCTAPPPPLSRCGASERFDTSITIQWRNPANCGGRRDCYFMIRVNDNPPQLYSPARGFRPDSQETYTVGNLQPDTTYSITVSIHNGVSDQDTVNARLRECSIVAKTIQGSVFMLGGVTYLNNTAVLFEDIAEGDSLRCTTAHTTCCAGGEQGQFYYPNDTAVSTQSQTASSLQSLYMTHNRGSIGLRRQRGSHPPLGRYRCEIPDGRGTAQNLYIRLGTAIDRQDQSNTTEPPVINVAAVVGDVIVLDIPGDLADRVEVRIEERQTAGSEPQTKPPIIFRADVSLGAPQREITIPPESLLKKDSTYFVKIKPVFKDKSEGEYGFPYIFKFGGSRSTGGLSAGNNSLDENTKLIIAVVATFVGTAIIISLLAISIALLCKNCKRKSSKLNGTTNPEYSLRKSSLD